MFCDLVGSTAIGARLDPEDFRDVVEAYHRCVTDCVTRLGGFVARYMGDGVLIYFGYPVANEDTLRACRHRNRPGHCWPSGRRRRVT
jgi:class 3 adenylate cyclase